jgi:hypothetical protein
MDKFVYIFDESNDNWSSGNSNDDFTAKTHPRPSAKQKSNLYFTTSLDLLNIPENQYFKSNLSDKMSDLSNDADFLRFCLIDPECDV